jgi:hypothetical protein
MSGLTGGRDKLAYDNKPIEEYQKEISATVNRFHYHHIPRAAVDALCFMLSDYSQKECAELSPKTVIDLIVYYISEYSTKFWFGGQKSMSTSCKRILDLNDAGDFWMAEFDQFRTQFSRYAAMGGKHKHKFYHSRYKQGIYCTALPRKVKGYSEWPFIDAVCKQDRTIIFMIACYLHPLGELADHWSERRRYDDKKYYTDMATAVEQLGRKRYVRMENKKGSDFEHLCVGISELIKASAYLGDMTRCPGTDTDLKSRLGDIPFDSNLRPIIYQLRKWNK